jgi:hypothetical protein
MMMSEPLTAAEEVLLAAHRLTKKDIVEFSEWELTVETWEVNHSRWGLRGFETKYPDHKRVMNEIMASGSQKVIGKGWIHKIRPNYYKVTQSGLAMAESIEGRQYGSKPRDVTIYEAINRHISHRVFQKYLVDQSEPKTWLGAAAFLGITTHDKDTLETSIKSIDSDIKLAVDWMNDQHINEIRRSDSARPVPRETVLKLNEFMGVLKTRFKQQFEAILKPKQK